MEENVSMLRMFNILRSFECVISACDVILIGISNSSYVVLTLKYVFMQIMSVTRKYFRSRFYGLLERQNMNYCVHSWWNKYIIFNMVSVKNILHLL